MAMAMSKRAADDCPLGEAWSGPFAAFAAAAASPATKHNHFKARQVGKRRTVTYKTPQSSENETLPTDSLPSSFDGRSRFDPRAVSLLLSAMANIVYVFLSK